MRFVLMGLSLTACGVEETGYLTDEGVFFTDDGGGGLVVVRPEVASQLGGALSAETFEGVDLGTVSLGSEGVVWAVDQAAGVRLTYTLDDLVESGDHPFAIAPGAPPEADPTSLLNWVGVDGDHLVIRPQGLEGELPFLVANTTLGASVVLESREETPLAGAAGDRVCISRFVDTQLTTSLCVNVEL